VHSWVDNQQVSVLIWRPPNTGKNLSEQEIWVVKLSKQNRRTRGRYIVWAGERERPWCSSRLYCILWRPAPLLSCMEACSFWYALKSLVHPPFHYLPPDAEPEPKTYKIPLHQAQNITLTTMQSHLLKSWVQIR
jgi:hypothetical protein